MLIVTYEKVDTFFYVPLDIIKHLVELALLHLRTLFHAISKQITNKALQCASLRFLYKLVADIFMDKDARGSTTTLAMVKEHLEIGKLNHFVHICVFIDDNGGFFSKL